MERTKVSVVERGSAMGVSSNAVRLVGEFYLVALLVCTCHAEPILTAHLNQYDPAVRPVAADDGAVYVAGAADGAQPAGTQAGGKINPKTTFLVPRSEKIQIAFTDGGRELQHSLHTDLLKLYKSVMEQLLERDQFIQTVRTLMDKTARLDDLIERVHRLERRVYRGHIPPPLPSETRPSEGSTSSRETPDPGEVSPGTGSDTGRRGSDEKLENVARKVRRQHEDISKLQEEHESFSKLIADQTLELQRQRDIGSKLSQTVGKMELEISRNKQMTIAQAELLDHHADKMETQRSTSEVIDARVNTLSSKVQWHDFRLSMMDNITSRLDTDYITMQLSLSEFQTRQRKITGHVEKLQTDTERCHVHVATTKMKVRFLEQDVDKLLSIVEKLTPANVSYHAINSASSQSQAGPSLHNTTLAGSARIQVQEMIDRSVGPITQAISHLNSTTNDLRRQNVRQEKHIERTSMDLELLREKGIQFGTDLENLRANVDDMRVTLNDWGSERDRSRRKLNKLEKDLREHSHTWPSVVTPSPAGITEPGGRVRTTVGHQRRTTRSLDDVTPVAREDTPEMPPSVTTIAAVTAATRPRSLTTESVIKVTTKPSGENDADKSTTHHGGRRPTTQTQPSERPVGQRLPNCTITGFGPARLVRLFTRIFTGTWMKDPTRPDDPRIFVLRNNVKVSNVREYANLSALADNLPTIVHKMQHRCTGTGHVMYNGHLYCNKYQTNRLLKYNFETQRTQTERLRNAGHNNTFPYSSGAYTDIDLAVDEQGLWAIYSSRADEGNLVVSKLNPDDMTVQDTWVTNFIKTDAANAFMVCGRLYVTVDMRGQPTRVGYIYDTRTSRELPLPSGQLLSFGADNPDRQTSLAYNPADRRLYAWNLSQDWDGLLVSYDVHFQRES